MTIDTDIDIAVIGGGVVGLAIGAELADRGVAYRRTVFVLERHERIGQETSSRNSEVIHAGIYYEPGTLKARLCVEGAELLRRRCVEAGIPHLLTGKVIVARTDSEVDLLEDLYECGVENGARGLRIIDGSRLRRLEPRVSGRAALLSPLTGVVDSWELMQHLKARLLAGSGELMLGARVDRVEPLGQSRGYRLWISGPDRQPERITSRIVINSAGLQADRVAASAGIDLAEAGYAIRFCKGQYFSIPRRCARGVNRLVYPVPRHLSKGLGVHLTRDLGGRLRLGPDARYVPRTDPPGYEVNLDDGARFWQSAVQLLPHLRPEDLEPDTAGVRPRLHGPGESARDFVVCHEAGRGLIGLFNLIGIESPGLTSSLALGRLVSDRLADLL
jgi:L-2-hydroxyglutarate oxidase LhgO